MLTAIMHRGFFATAIVVKSAKVHGIA
ncbi:hypothetical protein PMIN01_07556 [Paraphaeosphaeria minitans]|uniref:Uncharacterized protein n=1 Tax=Paraphaeosphaeria minitans TaxID=565426 RepID=A0A9P6GGH3_9PLEO|nr:hypothetical protein PMIN01_07556 [Paraphaeosphaeria minitans]